MLRLRWYYRCTDKLRRCREKYLQENLLIDQCLQSLAPLGITPEEAAGLRELIGTEAEKDASSAESEVVRVNQRGAEVQTELNRLTTSYAKGILDDEGYQAATTNLLLEKNTLKRQKDKLQRKHSALWIEPTLKVVNALESVTKQQTAKSIPQIRELVQKIGLNHRISEKKATMSFAAPYDFTAEILAILRRDSVRMVEPNGSDFLRSPKWCRGEDSNLHQLPDVLLRHACLPISPPRHKCYFNTK